MLDDELLDSYRNGTIARGAPTRCRPRKNRHNSSKEIEMGGYINNINRNGKGNGSISIGKCSLHQQNDTGNESEFSFTGSEDEDWIGDKVKSREFDSDSSSDSELGNETGDDEDLLENDSDALSNIITSSSLGVSDEELYVEASNIGKRKKVHDPFEGMYGNEFKPDAGGDIVFEFGQVFHDVKSIRDNLRDYAIKGDYVITRKKNDSKRITANLSNVHHLVVYGDFMHLCYLMI